MREKPRLKSAQKPSQGNPTNPLRRLEAKIHTLSRAPENLCSPGCDLLAPEVQSRLRSERAPQRGAGTPRSLGPGRGVATPAGHLASAWGRPPPKSPDGQNPNHSVRLAQTQGLGEAQSQATTLPSSRPPHLRPGWSSSSSGSLGRGRRGDGAQGDGLCQPVRPMPVLAWVLLDHCSEPGQSAKGSGVGVMRMPHSSGEPPTLLRARPSSTEQGDGQSCSGDLWEPNKGWGDWD